MPEPRRAAVIVNPSKFATSKEFSAFKIAVTEVITENGYDEPRWLETTVADPGRGMTADARSAGVDLVLAAGGDGTVRVVAAGMIGSDIPFGVLPMGTANLLARNLELPLDRDAAVRVAATGRDRRIDMVRVRVAEEDGELGEPDHFAVMAGIGADAVIMEEANPKLKRTMGSAAYVFSAAENADRPALRAAVRLEQPDGQIREFEREAVLLLVGNVGYLQAQIPLIPDAEPDDGRLDLLIASARGAFGRLRLLAEVLFRRHKNDEHFDLLAGRTVTITVDRDEAYELDGDPQGHCRTLVAEIVPRALLVRIPDEQPS